MVKRSKLIMNIIREQLFEPTLIISTAVAHFNYWLST
jgi:hypothetical protein